jgi:hypothetical protein
MADQVQAVGIFGRDDGQRGVTVDAKTGIHQLRGLTVEPDPAGERGTPQPGANRLRDVADRYGVGIFAYGTVGQGDVNHEKPLKNKNAAMKSRVWEYSVLLISQEQLRGNG